ncbi:hypothetical protein [Reichenbachiella faecimaris]|uniref:hypothetical protein n=1 Tax=Reichenbachiella faecimaris TaxID=692418 RepID=UPI001C87EC88|nr:hypothetical protein [Reichenbachiella faecimaris]
MIYIDALICPWNVFLHLGKYKKGIICLILQMTIVGWLPATAWSMAVIRGTKRRSRRGMFYSSSN